MAGLWESGMRQWQPAAHLHRHQPPNAGRRSTTACQPSCCRNTGYLADDAAEPAIDILRPYPAERMAAYPVTRHVNFVGNDDGAGDA